MRHGPRCWRRAVRHGRALASEPAAVRVRHLHQRIRRRGRVPGRKRQRSGDRAGSGPPLCKRPAATGAVRGHADRAPGHGVCGSPGLDDGRIRSCARAGRLWPRACSGFRSANAARAEAATAAHRDGRRFRFVCGQPLLLGIVACALFWNMAFFVLMAIYVRFALGPIGLNAAEAGSAQAAMGIGSLAAAFVAARSMRWLSPRTILMFGPARFLCWHDPAGAGAARRLAGAALCHLPVARLRADPLVRLPEQQPPDRDAARSSGSRRLRHPGGNLWRQISGRAPWRAGRGAFRVRCRTHPDHSAVRGLGDLRAMPAST